ncbi:MAG: methyltransferase domain-containing protein [Alphaproteobacteria bacterium]|nr:methyltransferase domain-containing protein [Alphaproteobacteria bacterium]
MNDQQNLQDRTITSFGEEWRYFDQTALSLDELRQNFLQYFKILPDEHLHANARGADLGCGSGRWARFVAPRVRDLVCLDASLGALDVAKRSLSEQGNCHFCNADVCDLPLADRSMDFAYCLGVLHHVDDTQAGLRDIARILKPGAPFLLYVYYRLEGRPMWYRGIWRASDVLRRAISSMSFRKKLIVTDSLAVLVYLPLARLAGLLEKLNVNVSHIPLSAFRHSSFYVMRNNSFDRFATPIEKRFSRNEIAAMLASAGFERIRFSESPPYWVALGYKAGVA